MVNQRSVVVTGASSGVGRVTALLLARRGWRVFAGVRSEADAQSLRDEGVVRLTPLLLDVTDAEQISAAVETVSGVVGGAGLDGLVNNAGVAIPGPMEYLPLEMLRSQIEINVIAQVAVTQAFLPLLRRATGRIVNMSSISGRFALPVTGAYAMSKFALEAFSDALRRELMPWGIHVAVIEPGSFRSRAWGKAITMGEAMLADLPDEARERYGPLIERVQAHANDTALHGKPPDIIAQYVSHALSADHPRTRYVMGHEARIGAVLAWLLPDRAFDWVINWQVGH